MKLKIEKVGKKSLRNKNEFQKLLRLHPSFSLEKSPKAYADQEGKEEYDADRNWSMLDRFDFTFQNLHSDNDRNSYEAHNGENFHNMISLGIEEEIISGTQVI